MKNFIKKSVVNQMLENIEFIARLADRSLEKNNTSLSKLNIEHILSLIEEYKVFSKNFENDIDN